MMTTLKPQDGELIADDFRPASRRRESRTPLYKYIWVLIPDSEPQVAQLTDCSPHGIGLLLSEPLHEGDEFGLKLRLDTLKLVSYSVRYCHAQEDRFKVGALLSGINGVHGHPELDRVFSALIEAASDQHRSCPG